MQENNRKIVKDREIPLVDYITILQYEYISYKVRSVIYPNPMDKDKFAEFAEKKKERILSISSKKSFKTIFTNEDYKKDLLDKFFNEWGMPNFKYRDDFQKTNPRGRKHWDTLYYFNRGRTVKIKTENNTHLGTIISYNFDSNTVTVDCRDNGIFELDQNYISVIFGEKIYKKLV